MGIKTAKQAIEQRFVDQYTGPLPVEYDNAGFVMPMDNKWIRLRIDVIDTNADTVGSVKNYRTDGAIIAQVFWPIGVGAVDACSVAETIMSIYEMKVFSSVRCFEATLENAGQNNGLYLLNIRIPFEYNEQY